MSDSTPFPQPDPATFCALRWNTFREPEQQTPDGQWWLWSALLNRFVVMADDSWPVHR